jgi:hypothetical protein
VKFLSTDPSQGPDGSTSARVTSESILVPDKPQARGGKHRDACITS